MNFLGFDTCSSWDYENGFYLTSDTSRVGKILAHFELYKITRDLPGHIVECGVFKGMSLIRFATFRDLCENALSKKVLGFDAFGDFPKPELEKDKNFVKGWEAGAGKGISCEELHNVFKYKKIDNVELFKGDINDTVPRYIGENPQLKISLLHIDTDVYKPSVTVLNYLYDHVVKGGVIILDDYGTEYGGTLAADEFFSDKNVLIRKLPISHTSPAYVIKP